jgi:nucleotide-binding universal stress UspA family protein
MSHIEMKTQEPPVRDTPTGRDWRPPPAPTIGAFLPAQAEPQKPVRKILVATDFSQASTQAVELAVSLAQQWDAELTILHVIDINAQSAEGESLPAAQLMSRLWLKGFEGMGRLAFALSGRVHAKTVVEEGLPWEIIAERSREFDLVIIGRARKKTHWKLFSHQTVQRVLQNAACPVTVVPDRRKAEDVAPRLP